MDIQNFLQRIQDTGVSQLIRESTWGYPVVGALHVLAIALFAGTLWITDLCRLDLALRGWNPSQLAREIRVWKWSGLLVIVATGALLFASAPVRYYDSTFFRIKMALLALILLNSIAGHFRRRNFIHSGISLVLWAAIIVAARGIAFF